MHASKVNRVGATSPRPVIKWFLSASMAAVRLGGAPKCAALLGGGSTVRAAAPPPMAPGNAAKATP
eukprot:1036051-Pyramimonas_sp.AAC.1